MSPRSIAVVALLAAPTAAFAPVAPRHATATPLASTVSPTDFLPAVRECIEEADLAEPWDAAVAELESSGLFDSRDEAAAALAVATRWKNYATTTSTIVRKYVSPVAPDPEAIRAGLSWLTADSGPLSVALRDEVDGPMEFLKEAIPAHPEAYLLDPEGTHRKALEASPDHIDADKFSDLWARDASLLKYTFNCAQDGCAGECGQCWVTTKY